ncbi:Zinc-binding domain present in Lin-11, Isl-1, Mec-3 [Rhizoctonia solani]|uniref:Zinc-binding domain present in Lin-11, Isl-1, Mec-3 n=1 Tax=Rhizoctonia solani TaxID=456999 RepID=A0A8H7LIR9_9AGAM|nr:Zinc-binding domain present in Lin-11, Isl-1, Mec-3 [Rhizoctonia solani]
MRSLSGYPEGPRDMHTRPPSQTFSVFNSNGTARSQAYTPTHTYSYSNSNSNSNSYISSSNTHLHSHPHSHLHTHSNPPLHSSAMSRSPAKQPGGLPDEDVYLPPRRVDGASRPSSPAKQSFYSARTPPGSPRIPAASLQPMANGNSSPGRSPSPSPSPGYLAPAPGSRPSTPSGSRIMGSARSDDSHTLLSPSAMSGGPPPSSNTSHSTGANLCSACGQPMTAQFVRALGTVFHLECFRCRDCNSVVASKFFPIDGPDGRQHPLCERDYFKRLNLICAKCDMALRDKKYHVEHFTCSVCPTLFGPQDSYYEHEGAVFCHWHYSTRFAVKCVGCNSAILKQFVEINRNQRDSAFHPECYLIHKFWNVKVVARPPVLPIHPPPEPFDSSSPAPTQLTYIAEEQQTTAQSLKAAQVKMEAQVYAIWTNLSAFEESSAACISDMLTQVSAGIYLDAIRMAEKFILHVEVLFAAIDEIEDRFAALSSKGMSHVREARMLCRKTVDLFTLLSHSSSSDPKHSGQGMSQELLALVTGLAHYLKILIRIALTGSLKLERELGDGGIALGRFLERMKALAKSGGDVRARRLSSPPNEPNGNDPSDSIVAYGYRSLAPEVAGESPFAGPAGLLMSSPSDLCTVCGLTVEEDCVRLGTYQRWHTTCIKCAQDDCTRTAVAPLPPHLQAPEKKPDDEEGGTKKVSSVRRPPAEVGRFIYEPSEGEPVTVAVIYCTDHGTVPPCRSGFEAVSRLEQYAFLLNVALRRLFLLLKKRGAIGIEELSSNSPSSHHRDSGVVPMKSVHLDRKLSATARLPKRSTIVESPTGKVAQRTDVGAQKSSAQHQGSTIVMGPSAPPSQAGSMHHVPLTNSVPVTLRQPTPRAPNQIQTQAQVQAQAQQVLPQSQGESPTGVLRPPFARNNTQVRIVDDSLVSPVGEDHQYERTESGEGLTLGDIPQLVEAEQRRSLPRQGSRRMIAELGPLEQLVVKHAAVQSLLRTPIRDAIDMDELGELLELKKNTFWGKLFKGGKDKQGIKKKGIFGVPLELLVEREGVDSMLGASRATVRVPTFVEDIVSAMKQMDMSVEGIFRKNGNIRRMNQVIEAIDRDPTSVEFAQENPVQLAALLKKFLREMPDPLLTYRLYKVWLAVQSVNASDKEKTRMLHLVTILLPKSHRDTLEVLFVFLKWVSLFSHVDEETGSKMDLVNLATVITPSILYSKGRDAAREESFMAIGVVTRLLEDQDQFFSVPDDFLWFLGNMEIWSGCLDLPMRDMQRRVESVMTRRRQQPSPSTNNQGPQPQQGYLPSGGPRSDSHTSIPTRPSDQNLARGRQGSNPLDVRPPPRINGNGNAGRSQSTERSQAPPQSAPPHPGLGHAPMSYPPPGVPSQQTPPSPRMTPREGPQPWKSPSRPPSQVMARPSMDYIQSQPSDRYPPPSQ